MKTRQLKSQWLGRIGYQQGLQLQESLVADIKAGTCDDTLLLLEHDPIYTIGRTRDQTSLKMAELLPHPVIQISRGGQATYHGPGQLVGYPILDLRQRRHDLHHYLRFLEETLIETLANFSIPAHRRDGLTGVWIENRKIASIGVGVRNWITMHGFALNVSSDLSGFDHIVPCGISGVTMTSVSLEAGREIEVKEVADVVSRHLQAKLHELD